MKRSATRFLPILFFLFTSLNLQAQCSLDAFGVIKFYPTKSGTREWTSAHWANGTSRNIRYASDTYDPTDWTEDHSGSTNGFQIDGAGVMNMSGGSPRFHINSLRTSKVTAQQFLNTEFTAYYRRIGTTGADYGGMVVGARSGPLGHASSGGNDCDATTYYARFRHDGKWDFEKELKHPTSDYWSGSGFHKQDPLWGVGKRMPENRWIGMKYIIYNIENDTKVKMELYIDSTSNGNPVNGGVWKKVGEVIDDGNWPAASSAITGCSYTDPKTIILQGHGTFLLRTDGDQAEYKMVSIREIDVSQTPNYVCSTNTLPTVSISSPATNTVFTATAASIPLTATANDADGTISKVEFYNGISLLNSDNSSPFTYDWTNVAAGTYTITARATDDKGGVTTSAAIMIIVNQAPTVSISSPANNSSFIAPATVTISATATDADGNVSKVEFFNGSTLLNSDNSQPYSYNWTSVGTGTYSITAKATDNNGAVSSSTAVNISVNANQPSVVNITSPVEGQTVIGALTLSLTATDPDGTIAKVEYFDGSTLIGTSTSSPYNFTWTNIPNGSHSITAKVTDSNGGETTSSAVTFSKETATGIAGSLHLSFANVYPNPSREAFIIQSYQEVKHLWVTNMLNEVVEEKYSIHSNEKIEIGKDLPAGTYVLMMQSASDKIETMKLVKVK